MTTAEPNDDPLRSPLGPLAGRVPDAPRWFTDALAIIPERAMLGVNGGMIETLSWGDRSNPGLLLMHGSAAHADMWRAFAPFFAAYHRVVAFSWPGMGGSSWRKSYELGVFADDLMAVAEQTGLFDGPPPTMMAHSMGGVPAVIAAHRFGARFAGAIIADTPLAKDRVIDGASSDRPEHPHRVYPTLEAALARFRFAPVQPPSNLYLADQIARDALEEVEGGWRWRFDPGLRKRMARGDSWSALARPACPLVFVTGEHSEMVSKLMPDTMRQAPAGTPHIVIPDAYHHLMVDQPIAFISVLRSILALWHA